MSHMNDEEEFCSAITLKGTRCTRYSRENGMCIVHNKISQKRLDPTMCSAKTYCNRQCKNKIYVSGKCRVHMTKKEKGF